MAHYQAPEKNQWIGRIDGDAPEFFRWHQIIHLFNLQTGKLPTIGARHQGIALLGFCCDEGVRRNQGRTGASAGPNAIRQACKNLPLLSSHYILVDAGNIVCDDENMEAAQSMLGNAVRQLRSANFLPVVLGGGHELSWGSFLGTTQSHQKQYGVINFDAHFDLRPIEKDRVGNSGTPFWQMQQWCSSQQADFKYLAIGIQQYSNTLHLFSTAKQIGAGHFLAEQFTNDQLEHLLFAINHLIEESEHIHLSIDLDVFASSHAPAVSAPAFNGIAPNSMFKRLLRHIIVSGKVSVVDIAELNPSYDIDQRTAKLAASIVFDIVEAADLNAEFSAP